MCGKLSGYLDEAGCEILESVKNGEKVVGLDFEQSLEMYQHRLSRSGRHS